MAERPNGQTKLIERDIRHLSEKMSDHAKTVEERFLSVAEEQQHQWAEINDTNKILTELRLTVRGVVSSTAIYAAIGSLVGSAVVSGVIGIIIVRLLQ